MKVNTETIEVMIKYKSLNFWQRLKFLFFGQIQGGYSLQNTGSGNLTIFVNLKIN